MMADQTLDLPCQNDIQVIKTADDQLAGNTILPVLSLPTNGNSLVPPEQVNFNIGPYKEGRAKARVFNKAVSMIF